MKTKPYFLILALLSVIASGCIHSPTATRTITMSQAQKADVLEVAIDVARELDLPPVAKLDKANGIVEFGQFGSSQIGHTAQVRIRPDGSLEVTVQRVMPYIKQSPEEMAEKFRTRIEERLREQRAGK